MPSSLHAPSQQSESWLQGPPAGKQPRGLSHCASKQVRNSQQSSLEVHPAPIAPQVPLEVSVATGVASDSPPVESVWMHTPAPPDEPASALQQTKRSSRQPDGSSGLHGHSKPSPSCRIT